MSRVWASALASQIDGEAPSEAASLGVSWVPTNRPWRGSERVWAPSASVPGLTWRATPVEAETEAGLEGEIPSSD